ncbi:MAG: CPBP family intramembrane metalloprotease [Paludibacteraceae bacterium]|nr:CPBP family intramembrane metalloprotease [Paludibacteraceae bacterium]
MKKYIKPVLVVVIYLVMQLLVGFLLAPLNCLIDPEFSNVLMSGDSQALMSAMNPILLASLTFLAGVLSIAAISALRLICWKTVFGCRNLQVGKVVVALVAGLLGILAINGIAEVFEISNTLEDVFENLSKNVWGILFLAVLGPIVEELVFREGIVGSLLRRGVSPLVAIVISALLFGLVHGNPIQIFAATFIGIILGVFYYKTGSIVLSAILHICVNSLSVITANVCDKETTLSSILGGDIYVSILVAVSAVVSILLMVWYWRSTSNLEYGQESLVE